MKWKKQAGSDGTCPPESEFDPLASQKGQVRWLLHEAFPYHLQGLKRKGFFVDLAAGHPTRFSNTFFIERYLGWRGLLIEPNPHFANLLRTDRASQVIEKVVSAESGKTVPFRLDNMELGGLVGEDFDNSRRFRARELESAEIVNFTTSTLTEILVAANAPRVMDYLSLDIEGAELAALRGTDLERFKWRAITAERVSLDLALLLDENGYVQVRHSQFDTFFIHKDFVQDSLVGKEVFKISPRKDW